jgi:hypothetical protein
MDMVLSRQRIASAFRVTQRIRGGVTGYAQERGVSRQRIYREASWVQRRLSPQGVAETEALRQKVIDLERQIADFEGERERRHGQTVVVDADKQAEFVSVGQALGVSLPHARTLLKVLLGEAAPSVATLGRMSQATAQKAGALLAILDEVAKPLVKVAAVDEIYTRAPVLMAVEPNSMCWVEGRKTDSTSGEVWSEVLATMPNLRLALRDEGTGLTRGVTLAQEQRQREGGTGGTPLVVGQDHFHSLFSGSRILGRAERAAKTAYHKAVRLQDDVDTRRRQGESVAGLATVAVKQWRLAEQAFDVWSRQTGAWRQVKDGLRLVTPEGQLNTPTRAAHQVSEALATLPETFAKCKRQLQLPETYTYLQEVHRQLAELPAPAEAKEAAVRIECLRRRPELTQGDDPSASALRALLVVSTVILAKCGDAGKHTATAVRAIFRSAWRASSMVECLNSVLRMHQASHRKLSQDLLNLKRLYWNMHPIRTGRRRHKSPYEHLGVQLPEQVSWWSLLKWPPERLRQELSAMKSAA